MDLSKIQKYFNYTPFIEGDPKSLMKDILKRAHYLDTKQKKAVMKAYDFAHKHHEWVKRLSGEPYIIHPVKVLEFLMDSNPDVATMQTALLHDVIEDTPVTYEDVKYHFGEEVADLCEWLAKVWKVRYKGEDRQIETLKKTFLAMGKDLRVIIVKIADRVHNIQTLHYHPKKEKQVRIAEETLKIYVPIAKRLWLYVYQGYLENGAFKILHPRDYRKIEKYVVQKYGDVDTFKKQWIQLLEQLCRTEKIPFSAIDGRLKSPYRIRKKLQKYHTEDIGEIMDIVAFRIIAEDVWSCYNTLWVIHKYYTPIFSKMKDYIALPKPNGYKSLHTTVLWMFNFPVEIQVRTQEMDKVANFGVAAHFAYSDADASVKVSLKQAEWIEKLQNIVKKYQVETDKEKFKDELNIEILQKNIFVYTPKGDIIELPLWSTVLDFAFRVHTDVGLKFRNGFINGKIVPIDYTLKTGDIVDIKTFKNKYTASRSWTQSLHTPSAKAKLNRFIREREKEEIFKEVTALINTKLKMYNLPLLGSKDDLIKKKRSWVEYERMLFRVRDKQISITKLMREVYKDRLPQTSFAVVPDTIKDWKKPAYNTIIVDHDKELEVILCPLCKPKNKQKIIARSWKDGIKIHTLWCDALHTIKYKKLLEAHWKGNHPTVYILRLWMLVIDQPGALLKILKVFDFLGIDLRDIVVDHKWNVWKAYVQIDLSFTNPGKIYYLIKDLEERKSLLNIVDKEIK